MHWYRTKKEMNYELQAMNITEQVLIVNPNAISMKIGLKM